jgi:hypothetical protein
MMGTIKTKYDIGQVVYTSSDRELLYSNIVKKTIESIKISENSVITYTFVGEFYDIPEHGIIGSTLQQVSEYISAYFKKEKDKLVKRELEICDRLKMI